MSTLHCPVYLYTIKTNIFVHIEILIIDTHMNIQTVVSGEKQDICNTQQAYFKLLVNLFTKMKIVA